MPGMMDTILNLGLNDESVQALRGPRATSASPSTPTAASWAMYGKVVLRRAGEEFDRRFEGP